MKTLHTDNTSSSNKDCTQFWRLDSKHCTVLLSSENRRVPQMLWFGARLPDNIETRNLFTICSLPLAHASLDQPQPLSLFPQLSDGLDAPPALRAYTTGDKNSAHQFSLHEVTTEQTDAGQTFTAKIEDPIAQIGVSLSLKLNSYSDVLSTHCSISNHANFALVIEHIASATLPLPTNFVDCLSLHGRWGLEFQTVRGKIGPQTTSIENLRGRTSHQSWPGAICGETGFNESYGSVYASHLAWSGNHRIDLAQLGDGRKCQQCSVALDPGELILEPGASYSTAVTHSVCAVGMNAASQKLHKFARNNILPRFTRTPRPVHANSWEALYFNHNLTDLFELIDATAALGAERFVLDDGWFRGRRDDSAGLGDWTVDPAVYPNSLHPIVERVRSHSMQFGLWFEPEMINPDSDLYRAHPDWALHFENYTTPLARQQLVLNMDRADVVDYLFKHISALVTEFAIDYIKWDFNRDLVLPGNGVSSVMHRQPLGSYKLMERLNKAFPALEIESCASGGARADWGVLQHTGRVWTSDSIDAIDRLSIQRGYSLFCPPEVMGAHIGHAKAHLTGRVIDIHTRAIVALQGQFGYEVDARNLHDHEKSVLGYYCELYKKNRAWISESSSWRLEMASAQLIASGLVSADLNRSLWSVAAKQSTLSSNNGSLVMTGLNAQQCYQVKLVSNNLSFFLKFARKLPAWMLNDEANSTLVSGAILMTIGLTLPIMPAQSALLIEAVHCGTPTHHPDTARQ